MTTTIEADRKQLAAAITRVRSVARNDKVMPALGMVRLVPRGNRLTIEATDLDQWRETSLPAKAAGAPVLVHPKTLVDFLKRSTHPDVLLSSTGEGVTVALNGSSATFATVDVADWPKQPETWETGDLIPLDPHLIDAIQRVSVAASPECSRPILTGLYFDGTTMVATDSYRLAWMGPFRPFPKMLVEAHPLVAAIKAVGKNAAMVVGPKSVMVCGKDGSAIVRRIEGEYPNWRKLPAKLADYPKKITFDRLAITDALKRCEAFVGKSETTPVRLSSNGGQLHMAASVKMGVRIDEWAETVAATGKLGLLGLGALEPTSELGLNPRYLREGVESCRADRVTLHVTDALKPVRLSDGSHFSYLLMPVRIV